MCDITVSTVDALCGNTALAWWVRFDRSSNIAPQPWQCLRVSIVVHISEHIITLLDMLINPTNGAADAPSCCARLCVFYEGMQHSNVYEGMQSAQCLLSVSIGLRILSFIRQSKMHLQNTQKAVDAKEEPPHDVSICHTTRSTSVTRSSHGRALELIAIVPVSSPSSAVAVQKVYRASN